MNHAHTIECYRVRSRIAAAVVALCLAAAVAASWTLTPFVAAIIATLE